MLRSIQSMSTQYDLQGRLSPQSLSSGSITTSTTAGCPDANAARNAPFQLTRLLHPHAEAVVRVRNPAEVLGAERRPLREHLPRVFEVPPALHPQGSGC